jgi:ribonuclease HII
MNLRYENKKVKEGYSHVIGCDEVGRGCLAGPVVAAAVILRFDSRPKWLSEVKDSKQLSAEKREYLSALIKASALWSIAEVAPEVVDEINVHNASLLAMKKAVEGLLSGVIPDSDPESKKFKKWILKQVQDDTRRFFLFVDGKFKIPNLDIHQESVVGGDNKVLSVAAASIIAKVYRDSLMQKFDKQYSGYEFARHKGYATEYHRSIVLKNGLSPIHRISFCKALV